MLSFTDFYIKNWGKVFGYCKKILKNAALAEEAAQQSFEKAFKAWDKLDSDNALSWILRVSHNVCVDIIRKEDRSVPFAEIIIPEEAEDGSELHVVVKAQADGHHRLVHYQQVVIRIKESLN